MNVPTSRARMAVAVEAKISAGRWVVGVKPLHAVGDRISCRVARRHSDIPWARITWPRITVITTVAVIAIRPIRLRRTDDGSADQRARDTETNGGPCKSATTVAAVAAVARRYCTASTDGITTFCSPCGEAIGAAAAGKTSDGSIAAISAAEIILDDKVMTNSPLFHLPACICCQMASLPLDLHQDLLVLSGYLFSVSISKSDRRDSTISSFPSDDICE